MLKTILSFKNITIGALILFLWRLALYFYSPFLATDGAWTLSHLFSMMSGNLHSSSFAHNFNGEIYLTHVKEIILYPFYYFLPTNTYTFIIVFMFFVAMSSMLFLLIAKAAKLDVKVLALFLFGYLGSTYAYGMRSEGYIFPILLLLVYQFYKLRKDNKFWRLLIIAFCASIAAFIHPVAGVVSVILVLINVFYTQKPILKAAILFGLTCVFSILITGGDFMAYVNLYANSNESGNHVFTFSLLPKFLTFAPAVIILAILAIKQNPVLNSIILFFAGLIILSFGRSYYLVYLFVILFSIFINAIYKQESNILLSNRFFNLLTIILIGFGFFFTHVLPTILTIENPNSGITHRKILEKVDQIGENNNTGLIWVSSPLGMEIINQENARLHHHFYHRMAGEKITLDEDDILLFYSKKQLFKTMKKIVSNQDYVIEEIVTPVKGKLRIGSLLRKRSDSTGLWMVSIEE